MDLKNIFRWKIYIYIWYLQPERSVLILTIDHISAILPTTSVVYLGI